MIATFFDRDDDNAHAKFQRWRAYHWGDGYFLNYRSTNDVMFHRSPCPPLGDTDWAAGDYGWRSLTRKREGSSTDRREPGKLNRASTLNSLIRSTLAGAIVQNHAAGAQKAH